MKRGTTRVHTNVLAPRPMPHVPNAADVLFEIGTEELPAAYLPSLIDQLGREAQAMLTAQHLTSSQVQTFGTPRRLVVIVRQLAMTQHKPGEEIRGPSKQAAYDGQGQPTQALLGFLRSHSAHVDQTKLVASAKGEYVYLIKPPTAIPTARLLPGLLSQLVTQLRAPKTMRWEASGVRFARPIRWLLALCETKPIQCVFGSVKSASRTWIGHPKRPRSARVTSMRQYTQVLRHAKITLDQGARRAWIEREVERVAARVGGGAAPEMVSHGLLDEVVFLVERPTILAGAFDRRYLSLPREVLLASMAKHQRVFAIEAKGRLLPQWIAVLEGAPGKPGHVREVIERILNARLADALFFWAADRRSPLDQLSLSGVSFHERLGSMQEKTQRLGALSELISDAWKLIPQERAHLQRACQLSKADLVTTMVKEFPTLQGVMGKYYAEAGQEAKAVALAIEEQYLPLQGRRPRTVLGSALSILDKYDTLTSYFGIGIEPTGDQDPFGLRRAAQGIVEVLWNARQALRCPVRFPLDELFAQRCTFPPFSAKDASAVGERVKRYLLERLYTFEWSVDGSSSPKEPARDYIDAVLHGPCTDLMDVMDRIQHLQRMQGQPHLLRAAKIVERTRNILRGATLRQDHVDPGRLQEAPERRLWDLYEAQRGRFIEQVAQRSYTEATQLFGEVFYQPLHDFFDQVLVNVPDQALQQNRLALMKAIHTLYTERIADLSKLTVLQQHEE